MNTNTTQDATQQAVNQNETPGNISRRFYVPSGTGMCVLTLHLRPEDPIPNEKPVVAGVERTAVTSGGTPSEGQSTRRQRRRTVQKMVRVLLSDGKPVDGREAGRKGLHVVYVPQGEVYSSKKHGTGVRYNRFFHKPLKSVPITQES